MSESEEPAREPAPSRDFLFLNAPEHDSKNRAPGSWNDQAQTDGLKRDGAARRDILALGELTRGSGEEVPLGLAEIADVRETFQPVDAPQNQSPFARAIEPGADRADQAVDMPAPVGLRNDISLFAGRNAAKFLRVYDEQERGYWPVFPCWPGFFVPLPWFLYRKMYLLAASSFIVMLASGLRASATFHIVAGLLPSVLGIMGRWLYAGAARRKIAEIRDRLPDDSEARTVIGMAGGVSIAGAVLGSFVAVLAILAIIGRAVTPPH